MEDKQGKLESIEAELPKGKRWEIIRDRRRRKCQKGDAEGDRNESTDEIADSEAVHA